MLTSILKKDRRPEICTKCNNEFDGEPDTPISADTEITFIPERVTW
jgi:molybdopterin converting factor small subunit